jgi:hypothetical protein
MSAASGSCHPGPATDVLAFLIATATLGAGLLRSFDRASPFWEGEPRRQPCLFSGPDRPPTSSPLPFPLVVPALAPERVLNAIKQRERVPNAI